MFISEPKRTLSVDFALSRYHLRTTRQVQAVYTACRILQMYSAAAV
jgi:hypothetical protein